MKKLTIILLIIGFSCGCIGPEENEPKKDPTQTEWKFPVVLEEPLIEDISINFTLLNPSKVKARLWLKGIDNNWHVVNNIQPNTIYKVFPTKDFKMEIQNSGEESSMKLEKITIFYQDKPPLIINHIFPKKIILKRYSEHWI